MSDSQHPTRFGVFHPPFHSRNENPTLALRRDVELMEYLDHLGFDEAWIGEHHSGGYETISSPEVFIAAAAERTRRIRFGTGAITLPFHHPLNVANRMVLLDHLTRGRTMLGVGPGSLPADAHMLGVDLGRARDMMEESLEAIVALLDGDEPVNRKTSWFELRDARLQLRPYTRPRFEIVVTAVASPSGPSLAGRFGAGLLSAAATQPEGFNALAWHWDVLGQRAREFGQTVDRSSWRLVCPVHLAETREQAAANVAAGLEDWVHGYVTKLTSAALPDMSGVSDLVEAVRQSGFAVIGTPDDAIEQINRLTEQSGGFGSFVIFEGNWADRAATLRSYELFAQHVAPVFQGSLDSLRANYDWATALKPQWERESQAAQSAAFAKHEAAPAAD
ncbi:MULTISPECIES: LLM class flavin-dependent oxidoreductase [Amycolatopsis]|uniref:Limonene 1,2-monooxygenase n=2 Tax=Amycolatopsis TaxID=1813 RepID=A0A1I3SEX1_9PSEU|nr:LLM class flavin-dependent oxidoreductase [Amycolatopsis sacchari]SFJ56522.1 limonene 1,2-monooxygenase [Amycolatopsis sacchari]